MGGIAAIGAATVGSGLGVKTQQLMSKWVDGSGGKDPLQANADYVNQNVKSMNALLGQALNNAMGITTNYTNQAVNQQNQSLGSATNALNSGLNSASGAINSNLNSGISALERALQNAVNGGGALAKQGFAQSQALQGPYAALGYNAADRYADSLGLPRPKIGSHSLAQGMFNATNLQPGIQQLQEAAKAYGNGNMFANPNAPTAPVFGQAPIAPTINPFVGQTAPGITDQQIMQYIQSQPQLRQMWASDPHTAVALMANNPSTANIFGNRMNQPATSTNVQQALMGFARNTLSQSQAQEYARVNQAGQTAYNQNVAAQMAPYQASLNAYNQDVQQKQQAYNQQVGLFGNNQSAYNSLQQQLNQYNPQVLQQALAAQGGMFGAPVRTNVGFGGAA